MIKEMDILTDKQRERVAQDARVAKAYKSLQLQHPEAKPTRLMTAMAESGAYPYKSAVGIRKSLIRSKTI